MSSEKESKDVYIIPPNFIDTGTLFGGTIKLRNVIEAGVIAFLISFPVLKIPVTISTKIIVLCLTALPAGIFAVIGWNGESLSSFILNFFKYLRRRIVGAKKVSPEKAAADANKAQKLLLKAKNKVIDVNHNTNVLVRNKKGWIKIINETSVYLPIKDIKNGIIYTKDNRYVKIVEVSPINFLLRNTREQKNIIYSFVSYLKVSPAKTHFKVLTKKADINKHINKVIADIAVEKDPKCKRLQEDYIALLKKIGSKEAVTRRFFIIFEYEPGYGTKASEMDAVSQLQTTVRNASSYLRQCGNEIIEHENEDEFIIEAFYSILNRKTSSDIPLPQKVQEIVQKYIENGWQKELNNILVTEFIAPQSIDFSHMRYTVMDGVYHSYLFIPTNGYKPRVVADWISLLVNAGEGIDVDLFCFKQPKDRMKMKLGQQIRINRSKIKDTSDTNDDFEDLSNSIRSGYFLKNGLSNNEDFYYTSLFITITADSVKELDWRVNEMKKLMISQDLDVQACFFREEQAFLSALPLVKLDKKLFDLSKRNVLTSGIASCYPFTSFEMCDNNGIMLGINKHNNSLIIVDIFNSRIYKNANMAILGTSGAGKTFTMQLMALRMRRKNIQTFIVAPLKGHEFYRACNNIGGEFIQISPASQNCINVMEIRKSDSIAKELIDGPVIERSELASKIQRLHIFFSLLIPDMNHEEKQLLDETLVRTYGEKGIDHNNESLIDTLNPEKYRDMPILADLYNNLIKKSETKRLANILNRLVNGSAKTFSQHTNVNLDNKYTVLDISELSGDLLTVGMFVALDYVWDKAKEDRTAEKAIFIDEAWQLIGASSNTLAAEFVLEIFKIIRGYGGSAICASQDLNDFFALENGKFGKGIINNAKTKIILNLEDEEAQRVQEVMHLSDAEIMAITHFQRGNGLISTNNNNVSVEFKASSYEKELVTSDRQELQEILRKKRVD